MKPFPWVMIAFLTTHCGQVTDANSRAQIAAIVSAVSPRETAVFASLAVGCAKRIAQRRPEPHVAVMALGANGVTTRAWVGLAENMIVETWIARLHGVVQRDACHDIGRAFRTAMSEIADGGVIIVAATLRHTVLDVSTGKCGPPGDPLSEIPWGSMRRRNVRALFVGLDASGKNRIEDRAHAEGSTQTVRAYVEGEALCDDGPYPPESLLKAVGQWLADLVQPYEVAQVLSLLAIAALVIARALWNWLFRRP